MATPSFAPPIDRALVPAAGYGTRLRPLTSALPKEMLPLGRKPVLEHVVEELSAAGITRVLFVISTAKEMIRTYFGDGNGAGMRFDYVYQPDMRGLGDAILRGEAWSEGAPFAVAFGDCVIDRGADAPRDRPAPLERLLETHRGESAAATVLTETVPLERTKRYGMLAPAVPIADRPRAPFAVADLVEKPAPDRAPSRQAVAARWVLTDPIFEALRRVTPAPNGELQLTDAVRALRAGGAPVWAVPLYPDETRRDIGGWDTYLLAAAKAALADPEHGDAIRAALCSAVGDSAAGAEP